MPSKKLIGLKGTMLLSPLPAHPLTHVMHWEWDGFIHTRGRRGSVMHGTRTHSMHVA